MPLDQLPHVGERRKVHGNREPRSRYDRSSSIALSFGLDLKCVYGLLLPGFRFSRIVRKSPPKQVLLYANQLLFKSRSKQIFGQAVSSPASHME
jgi:hypothetical protein